MAWIYLVLRGNNPFYVGSTKQTRPEWRWVEHKKRGLPWKFCRYVVLEKLPDDIDNRTMLQVEQAYINAFDTLRNGANLTSASTTIPDAPQYQG